MPAQGRPRLTPEVYETRLQAYCARYKVTPLLSGIPPFPTGRRETPQHREWIALYKAYNRLGRRERGQCERCAAPASDGSVFCEDHRGGVASRAASDGASLEDRRALWERQDGDCPICSLGVDLRDSVDHSDATGRLRAVLHQRCNQLVGLAESLGPEVLGRLRSYLWPKRARAPQ